MSTPPISNGLIEILQCLILQFDRQEVSSMSYDTLMAV